MTPILPEGGRIGVVAPSGRWDPGRLEAGLTILRDQGFELVRYDEGLTPKAYLAAPDDIRAARLTDALTDPSIDAVWAIRGGFGVTRVLPLLDGDRHRAIPILGFSDLTPLLHWHRSKTGALCVHGPVIHSLPDLAPPWRAHLFDLLAGRPTAPLQGRALVSGRAEGPLVGGNLSMIAATCGTPYQIDARHRILLLEDVGEAPYRIDRMLVQLQQAGVLRQLIGVAVGSFTGPAEPDDVHRVFKDHFEPLAIPVLVDLPIGHTPQNAAWPVGTWSVIEGAQLRMERPST